MSTLARLGFLFVFLLPTAATAAAQITPPLRVDGIGMPWIERFETAATTDAPTSARTAALVVLAWLRLANHERARTALATCCAAADLEAGADRVDPAWAAAASLWYLRATHDEATIRRHLPRLATTLARIGPTASRERFADETLLVHGLLCIAAAESFLDLDRPRDASRANGRTRQAIDRWLDVERRAWQPGRQHFRPLLTNGGITLPEPADATVLWPAAAGMLVATGELATLHARTVLRAAFEGDPADSRHERFTGAADAALLLTTATQFDPKRRAEAWARFASPRDGEAGLAIAALDLDTALFAITGVRLATGAGVDEGWLRFRPWLPANCDRVRLRGLHAEGTPFDLEVERRRGALAADESNDEFAEEFDAESAKATSGERLCVRITVAESASRPVRIVLQGPTVQFVGQITPGVPFVRSLPTSEP